MNAYLLLVMIFESQRMLQMLCICICRY